MRRLQDLMDEILPVAKVVADVSHVLQQANGRIELEDGWIEVPKDAPVQVLSRNMSLAEGQFGFGNCFRAVVAIGGLEEPSDGVLSPRICFATPWYNESGRFITIDFSARLD
jgi:hypothetical protein